MAHTNLVWFCVQLSVFIYQRVSSHFFNHKRIMNLIKFLSSSLSLFLLLSVFISDGVYTVYSSRNLLQAGKTPCPINFKFMNYTIIINSRCKGPHFPHVECCAAFRDFACPYRNLVNDESTDCLTLMLSNIRLYGRYPVGLFSSYCLQGKQHLDCPGQA